MQLVILFAILLLSACTRQPSDPPQFRIRRVAFDAQGGGDSAISPDGTRFLTSLRRSGNWDVWMYDLTSNKWTQLTSDPSDEFEAKWSPDSQSIVFTSTRRGNKDIFLMNLRDRKTISLTDDPDDDEYPTFSPDGRSVVFTGGSWPQRRYFLVDVDGKNRRAVSEPSQAGACTFHPQGQNLVCHNYDTGTGKVYVYPIAGGDRLQVSSGSSWDYKPTVSPDGRWLAFSRSREEGPSQIWLMPYPTGRAFPLTRSSGDDRWPTWSASGDKLLFHRLVDRGRAIQIFDRKTRQVTSVVDAGENPGPASFDPSGRRIVYSWRSDAGEQLRIRDLDRGSAEDVSTPGEASFPRWSPNGRRIAFALKQDARWSIATLDLKTKVLRSFPMAGTRGIRSALDWSPDSRKVVFHASTIPFEANLYLLDVDSGSLQNLTNDHWYSESPGFTRDGAGITFMSTRGGNWTWGFFELTLAKQTYQLLAGPDYVEKNYPRLGPKNELLWSEYTPDGLERIAIRDATGGKSFVKEIDPNARWPSLSTNGEQILYTEMDHSVEYWLAEGLNAPGSPLLDRPQAPASMQANLVPTVVPTVVPTAIDNKQGEIPSPHRTGSRTTPLWMHHR